MADTGMGDRRRAALVGFVAAAAGGVATAAMMTAGLLTQGVPVVALALWERALRVMPMEVFGFLIVRLKFLAKPLAFWGMLASLVIGLGVLGLLLERWPATRGRPARSALAAFLLSWIPLAALTIGPASMFLQARLEAEGAAPTAAGAAGQVLLALAFYALAFSVIFTVGRRLLQPRAPATPSNSGGGMTRRQLLHRSIVLAGGVLAGSTLARVVTTAARPAVVLAQSVFQKIKGLPPEVTPTKDFYIVSKNPFGFDPGLDAAKWSLDIGGLVGKPRRLAYQDVKALPAVERYHTLECISNEIGGDLIGNARWKGARLRDLLALAGGVGPKTTKVAFRCADGYTESIPLQDALHPDTLVVYEMNAEPLTPKHGFPVRLLVPGYFGMKNPKWITRIEPVDYNFLGYWERSGWTDDAVVQTMAKFTTRAAGARAGEDVGIGGVAYAGKRGIRAVEFSPDNARTWLPAEVKPALGPHTWVLWGALWKPAAAGDYTLAVRARDGTGRWQTAAVTATLPSGATGYHRVRVRVGR
jgi:DMSO/TMAO reductase YedYZ molybdopterin-dependent catalytic subunit